MQSAAVRQAVTPRQEGQGQAAKLVQARRRVKLKLHLIMICSQAQLRAAYQTSKLQPQKTMMGQACSGLSE